MFFNIKALKLNSVETRNIVHINVKFSKVELQQIFIIKLEIFNLMK
jgi:hypothetical protein